MILECDLIGILNMEVYSFSLMLISGDKISFLNDDTNQWYSELEFNSLFEAYFDLNDGKSLWQ